MNKKHFKKSKSMLTSYPAGEILNYLLIVLPSLMVLLYYIGKYVGSHLYPLISQ